MVPITDLSLKSTGMPGSPRIRLPVLATRRCPQARHQDTIRDLPLLSPINRFGSCSFTFELAPAVRQDDEVAPVSLDTLLDFRD